MGASRTRNPQHWMKWIVQHMNGLPVRTAMDAVVATLVVVARTAGFSAVEMANYVHEVAAHTERVHGKPVKSGRDNLIVRPDEVPPGLVH